ncbi:MAG: alpha/beta family hydrolase [Candidatus Saccharimonadales bacterium]
MFVQIFFGENIQPFLSLDIKELIIVAKSLGRIVASYYLDQHRENSKIKLVILGYVVGGVKTSALQDALTLIIQGENDRFGNAKTVRNELAQHNAHAKVIEIPKADHSYRDINKAPIYQERAISKLLSEL